MTAAELSAGALASVKKATLRESALSHLRAAILSGALAPGTALGEVAVSEQLGVSRGTVRESFRTLQQDGLIEPHGRGLRVRVMSAHEIGELFRVRAELEGLAVEEVLALPDADAVVARIAEALPPASGEVLSYSARMDLDLGFHRALVEGSGNRLLLRLWTALENQARVVALAHSGDEAAAYMGDEHHRPIIEAMRSGDVQAARWALREHMAASSVYFSE